MLGSALPDIFIDGLLVLVFGIIFHLKRYLRPSSAWEKIYISAGLVLLGRSINFWDIISGGNLPSFINGPNKVVLEGAIGYIGGIIFLSGGFLELIPKISELRSGSKLSDGVGYLYRAADSVIYPGCDLKKVSKTICAYTANSFKLKALFIHLVSPKGGTLKFYNGKAFDYNNNWYKREFPIKNSLPGNALTKGRITRSEPLESLSPRNIDIINGGGYIYIGQPIITENRHWGVLGAIIPPNYEYRGAMEKFMKYLSGRIGACLDYEKANREVSVKQRYINLYLSTMEILNKWHKEDVSLPKMADKLREYIGYEYLFLARLDGRGENMWRFVYSDSGKSLVDKGVVVPRDGLLLGRVIRSKRPVIFDFNPRKEDAKYNLSIPPSNCIGVPLYKRRKMIGAILLTDSNGKTYNQNQLNMLRFIAPIIAEHLFSITLREQYYKREKLLSYLAEKPKATSDEREFKDLIRKIAETFTKIIPITSCRVMLLDEQEKEFFTVGLYQTRDLDWDKESLNIIPAESAQFHLMALKNNHPIVVDFNNQRLTMKEKEKRLLYYTGISGAVLIPIIGSEQKLGIISLGEMRNTNRQSIGAEDINFAAAVGMRLGLILQGIKLRKKIRRLRIKELTSFNFNNSTHRLKGNANWRNDIMNALSSIMGSVELINNTEDKPVNPRLKRYLEIIQHNSEKIYSLTNGAGKETHLSGNKSREIPQPKKQ